jgi:precorrin-2/cobalt-factor-2 C20-methyltransferase
MTYPNYGYILRHIKASAPHVAVESIPGITSYQAAAARLNTPLVEGEESLLVTFRCQGRRPSETILLYAGNRGFSEGIPECQ